MKDESKERLRRMWAFGPNLLAAIVSVILGPLVSAFVAYYIAKH
jgi:hypothetical protein